MSYEDETFVDDASALPRWCTGCGLLIGQCMTPTKAAFLATNPNTCQCCTHRNQEHNYAGCSHQGCNCKWPLKGKPR